MNFKKIVVLVTFLSLFVLPNSTVLAQTTNPPTQEEMQREFERLQDEALRIQEEQAKPTPTTTFRAEFEATQQRIEQAGAKIEQSNDEFTSLVGGMFGVMVFFLFLPVVLFLTNVVIAIWAIFDCSKQNIDNTKKQFWILGLIVTMFIGIGWVVAIAYFASKKSFAKVNNLTITNSNSEKEKVKKRSSTVMDY